MLDVVDLRVRFAGDVDALRGVSFSLGAGQSLAVVGESGSGKSTLAMSLAGMVQPPEASGSVRFDSHELLGAGPELLRSLRWERIAMTLQGAPFNPVASVGAQIAEPLLDRRRCDRSAAHRRAEELAGEALLDPALLERFPHELSGGERRRAALAMALALDPELVVLDEPTAGLDPVTAAALVSRIAELREARGFALLAVTHDLAEAQRLADQCMVLYAGEAMEVGHSTRVLREPTHPYSWALIGAYPVMSSTKDLRPIRGRPSDPRAVPPGCPYNPRCTQAEKVCRDEHPALVASRGRLVACHFGGVKTLLEAASVSKGFRTGRRTVQALDSASFQVREGESVGIIGPSGSGKSTLARILSGDLAPDSGQVLLGGEALPTSWRRASRTARRSVQLVMQDPWDALSPRLSVAQLVREPLDVLHREEGRPAEDIVAESLESVGLPFGGPFLQARTHELSGGQLQRIALARALVAGPRILIADEPTAMLDPSEQARMLVVLRERQVEMGLGLVLVSHDIAVVRKVTDRIVVLDGGRVVEEGPSARVSTHPRHPTTRLLIGAAPSFEAEPGDTNHDEITTTGRH